MRSIFDDVVDGLRGAVVLTAFESVVERALLHRLPVYAAAHVAPRSPVLARGAYSALLAIAARGRRLSTFALFVAGGELVALRALRLVPPLRAWPLRERLLLPIHACVFFAALHLLRRRRG